MKRTESKPSTTSIKSSMNDSFRDYMHRKIDLQRRQFGLILPRESENMCNEQSKISDVSKQDMVETSPEALGMSDVLGRLQQRHGRKGSTLKLALARKKKLKQLSSSPCTPIKDSHISVEHLKSIVDIKEGQTNLTLETIPLMTSQPFSTDPTESPPRQILDAVSVQKRPDLFFMNVVVLINGYTNPSADSLMRMLQRHGGDVEKYETDRVTHIIAEQLSTAKANIYKKQRKPIPVVHPRWITDSVQAGKKLSYNDYLLDQVRSSKGSHEATIKSFLCSPSASMGKQTEGWTGVQDEFTSHPISSPPSGVVRTVGNDPHFLESYFASSRLSFIGSFKQRIKPNGHFNDNYCTHGHKGQQRYVLHIDMDFFFAAVALRKYPQYKSSPVAISHCYKGNDTASTSELSTCNYIARNYGVRKGMFLKHARELCPDLVILPYDYEGYEEVSNQLGDILQQYADKYCGCMEQVSCDEAYLELSILDTDDITHIANELRQNIVDSTQCTASIGIGTNKLMAKLATDRIKPDGLLLVENPTDFLQEVSLGDLPGIGFHLEEKLKLNNLKTVQDVLDLGEDDKEREGILESILGPAKAKKIVSFCRGHDDRLIRPVARKSIGVECNYGVRFGDNEPFGIDHMVLGLAQEVERRMLALNIKGRACTLKVKQRKPNAPPPGKFNGCGSCIDHSKSASLPLLTNDSQTISQICMKLLAEIAVPKEDVRGMGIVLTKLDNVENHHGTLLTWFDKHDVISEDTLSRGLESDKVLGTSPSKGANNEVSSSGQIVTDTGSPVKLVTLDQSKVNEQKQNIPIIFSNQPAKDKTVIVKKKRVSVEISAMRKKKAKRGLEDMESSTQTSVKSMLQLASIKSRRDEIKLNGENVSLTQLDYLPLELQLEVAASCSENAKHVDNTNKRKRHDTLSVLPPSRTSPRNGHDITQPIGQPPYTFTVKNFYRDSIAPFSRFLDDHAQPSTEEVEQVMNFLRICTLECRLDEVVQYLRILKRNQNSWGRIYYNEILEAFNKFLLLHQGRELDRQWLGI